MTEEEKSPLYEKKLKVKQNERKCKKLHIRSFIFLGFLKKCFHVICFYRIIIKTAYSKWIKESMRLDQVFKSN